MAQGMRPYGKVAPQFWRGETGRSIVAAGKDAIIVAVYLLTGPAANMIGLYEIAVETIAADTGLGLGDVQVALDDLEKLGFAFYEAPHVFVPEMARFQIDEVLKRGDNRVKHIMAILEEVGPCRFTKSFHGYYRERFNLPDLPPRRIKPKLVMEPRPPSRPPSEGASEGASQGPSEGSSEAREQRTENREQEQEQIHVPDGTWAASGDAAPSSKPPAKMERRPPKDTEPGVKLVLDEYHRLFVAKFGTKPVIHGVKHGAMAKTLVRTHGTDKVLALVAVYLDSHDEFFQRVGYTFDVFFQGFNRLITTAAQGGDLLSSRERKTAAAFDTVRRLIRERGQPT